jgi:N-acetylglucosamine kinase-like BadF-type ATPase
MNAMKVFLGLDGGGTKTDATAIDEQGLLLARYIGGPSNPHSTLQKIALSEIMSAIDGLLEKLPDERREITSICLAVSGFYEAAEKSVLHGAVEEHLSRHKLHIPVFIQSEGQISLMATVGSLSGVLVIAGTGSICYGYSKDGSCIRTGGWGHLLGDEGSGYQLGLRALKNVMRSYDGVIPPTAMTDIILREFGWADLRELKGYIYDPAHTKAEIAAFSKVCIQAAEAGDPAAMAILTGEAQALAATAAALLEHNPELQQYPVVLSGSVFHYSPDFRRIFSSSLLEDFSSVTFIDGSQAAPPSVGAALTAAHLTGHRNSL